MHIPIILSITDKSYYYDIRVEMGTWKLDGKCLLSLLALSSSCWGRMMTLQSGPTSYPGVSPPLEVVTPEALAAALESLITVCCEVPVA